MTRIVVTGGSGKAGRAVVGDLREHGYEVLNVDRVPSAESSSPDAPIPLLAADVTDFGQALEALSGADAVVHLAAIPSPGHATPDTVFRTNVTSTHAVFAAAARLGLERVVWASSETTLGLPFDTPPDYAPVDEAHVRPETSYALSKVLGEEMARQFSRWSGIPIVGLRFSNIMVRDDYERFSVLLGRPPCAQVEPLGLRRRGPRRPERAARAGGRRRGRGRLHRRGGRHGHAAPEPRADGRGLSGRAASPTA